MWPISTQWCYIKKINSESKLLSRADCVIGVQRIVLFSVYTHAFLLSRRSLRFHQTFTNQNLLGKKKNSLSWVELIYGENSEDKSKLVYSKNRCYWKNWAKVTFAWMINRFRRSPRPIAYVGRMSRPISSITANNCAYFDNPELCPCPCDGNVVWVRPKPLLLWP